MHELRAEMVASVWKLLVEEGQQVEEGTTVAILESMKMEIPLFSPIQGTIASLHVSEGDSVDEGDLIATLQ